MDFLSDDEDDLPLQSSTQQDQSATSVAGIAEEDVRPTNGGGIAQEAMQLFEIEGNNNIEFEDMPEPLAQPNRRLMELKKLVDDKDAVAVFPQALVDYYLRQAGCELADDKINKLVSLELQNYLQDILEDVKKISTLKANIGKPRKKQKTSAAAAGTGDKTATEQADVEETAYSLQSAELETVLKNRNVQTAQAPFHPATSE